MFITDYEPIYIIGVYLPSDNNINNFDDNLKALNNVSEFYENRGGLIVAGDFNSRIFENPCYYAAKHKSEAVKQFVRASNLTVMNSTMQSSGIKYTFKPCKSTLDYIMCNTPLLQMSPPVAETLPW